MPPAPTVFHNRISNIVKEYPFLQDLIQRYPYLIQDLAPGMLGKTEYFQPSIRSMMENPYYPEEAYKVSIDRATKEKRPGDAGSTVGHEYTHVASDISPSIGEVMGLQRANPTLYSLMSANPAYKPNDYVEEGISRILFPSMQGDAALREGQTLYLTPQQQAFMGHIQRFLKGGPDALWSGQIDPQSGERDTEPGKAYRYFYNQQTRPNWSDIF